MKTYYLRNNHAGFVGNSPLWWAKNNGGYTSKLENVKKWSIQELIAENPCTEKFSIWESEHIDLIASKVADSQDILSKHKVSIKDLRNEN